MPVYIQKNGPVTVITLSRPEVRNAVDRQTAQELADAFRAFETDQEAQVAVLTGDQGQFCAGADLKKIAAFTRLCLQNDRMSAIEQSGLNFEDAMANEFNHGLTAMQKEAVGGAARFAKGAGRHGKFGPPQSELK
jgi:enoyl-CoA hydratase/carnithine racemase